MNLSAKVAQNTIIQIISKIISVFLGLLVMAVITRRLGQEGFGQYTVIITFLSFFAIASDFGLTLVTAQMISYPGINKSEILSNLLSFRLFSAIFILGLAPLLALFFPYGANIKLGIFLAAASFLFASLSQIIIGFFQVELKMARVSLAEIIGRLILLAGVSLRINNYSYLNTILLAGIVSSLANFLFLFLFSVKLEKIRLGFNKKIWQQIFHKSWPIAITIFFNLLYLKTDTIILSLLRNNKEVGIYGAAYKVLDVLTTLPFMFAGIVLPILTKKIIDGQTEKFGKILQKSFDFMVISALPMLFGVLVVSDRVMTIIAGTEFKPSAPILKILMLANLAIFTSCIFSHAIIALDKQKKVIPSYIFTSITSIIAYFIFIKKFSYIGAAWVTVYSEAIMFLSMLYYTKIYGNFMPSFKIFFKSLLASILMLTTIYPISLKLSYGIMELSLIILIGSISYVTFLYFLRGVNKKDFLIILNKG